MLRCSCYTDLYEGSMKNKKTNKQKQRSLKAHQEDPARNDKFYEERGRPSVKQKNHKLAHGHYFGKKWFPQG